MNSLKIKIEKILEDTDDEIIFVVSEESDGVRKYIIKFLVRFGDVPHILNWDPEKFSTLDDAVKYYKKATK
jgi:hypothetical protein